MTTTHRNPDILLVWPHGRHGPTSLVTLPPGYSIRNWRDEDAEAWIRIHHEAVPTFAEADLRNWLDRYLTLALPDGIFMVTCDETREPVATAGTIHNTRNGQFPFGGQLAWVATSPRHQRLGLGTAVSAYATLQLMDRRYRDICVCTGDDLLAAIKIYLRLGYVPYLYEEDMEQRWRDIMTAIGRRADPDTWRSLTARPSGVTEHYGGGDLGTRILDALRSAGKDLDALTVDDLAPVDAFHIRGRAATEELAGWVDLSPSDRILDVGCGVGGTSRYLANTFGCEVVGVDLTEAYCRVATMLSSRVGLTNHTSFRAASALAIPFDSCTFDVAWTEHVQMNIVDKAAFYGELHRMLRPSGHLAFHDIFAGNGEPLHFPVPWGPEESISHLVTVDEATTLLHAAGFETVRWEEKTDESIAFFHTALERLRTEGPLPVGLHLLMGDEAPIRLGNVLRNLEEGRIRVVQAVLRRIG